MKSRTAIETVTRDVSDRGLRRVVTSSERRAVETAHLIGSHLFVPVEIRPGLEEHHRLAGQRPHKEADYHRKMRALFSRSQDIVFGTESADMALDRFADTVWAVMAESASNELIVSHGTVIALFVAAMMSRDAYDQWRQLAIPDLITLDWPPSTHRIGRISTS